MGKVGFCLVADPVELVPPEPIPEVVWRVLGHGGARPNISYLYHADAFDWVVMGTYFGILLLLSVYGIYRFRLVYLFLRYRHCRPQPARFFAEADLPCVTVQLPIYNEMYVVERLIRAATQLDYPRDRLEIQVLDDSTDETSEICRRLVEHYRALGHDIVYLRRGERRGFKAGALAYGLSCARGELIAIFDADFIPRPDCLRRMVHYFTDPQVGMVQMRWSYINADYNLLTRLQQIMLDGHFVVEQTARSRSGGFFNFNGTAGMWRRTAIEWSGGWHHETLAEDTDLSYRAQLFGWKFVYLLEDDVPSELPVDMNSFKVQQRRWAKGVLQVGAKLIGRIFRSPLPWSVKLELFFRFTNNANAPFVILLSLLHWPVLLARFNQGWFHLLILDVPILLFATASVIAFYGVAIWHLYPDWKRQAKYLPLVMALGIGLALNNARAALEALLGIRSPFARTPKFKIESRRDEWAGKRYTFRHDLTPLFELALAAYFVFVVFYAARMRIYGTIPFLVLFFLGYGLAGAFSVIQGRAVARATR